MLPADNAKMPTGQFWQKEMANKGSLVPCCCTLVTPISSRVPAMSYAQIEKILADHPQVQLAYLFGSLASGQERPDSDADVAVQMAAPLSINDKMQLIEALAQASGRAIDLIDLRKAGEPLLGQILQHGIRLKGSDALHAELVSRHVFNTEDFLPYLRRILAERRKAWTH
tara:strand:- start:342 stop:851 length:510 start_codon:yes stop_codon:yes gene_type:complete